MRGGSEDGRRKGRRKEGGMKALGRGERWRVEAEGNWGEGKVIEWSPPMIN